ncbi:MAG: mannosyltransferase family protein [Solirubrobacteraceae bacterium]
MEAQTTDPATARRPLRAAPIGSALRPDRALRDATLGLSLALAVVLAAGLGAHLAFGAVPHGGFDPPGVVDRLGGGVRDTLAAPFARWDSVWYLTIARGGYQAGSGPAFFPLYPLLVAVVGALGPGLLAAGVLVSLVSLLVALRLLWRLTELEVGHEHPAAPRLAVLAAALGPMAFFFTAVYSESLFLALSLGAFLAARQGRWARAGALGALSSATHSQGLLLVGALALLCFEQRRGVALRLGRSASAPPPGPRPRRRQALWLLAIPLGFGAYLGWLWVVGLDPLAPLSLQKVWYRHYAGPVDGVVEAARAAVGGARQILAGQTRTIFFPPAGGDPVIAGWHNMLLFVFLLGTLLPLAGALRRLPLAYGAYAATAILLAVSYPVAPQPLTSLPRYAVVLFPLPMAVGVWLARRPRLRLPVLGASATALAVFTGLFATWHWIA